MNLKKFVQTNKKRLFYFISFNLIFSLMIFQLIQVKDQNLYQPINNKKLTLYQVTVNKILIWSNIIIFSNSIRLYLNPLTMSYLSQKNIKSQTNLNKKRENFARQIRRSKLNKIFEDHRKKLIDPQLRQHTSQQQVLSQEPIREQQQPISQQHMNKQQIINNFHQRTNQLLKFFLSVNKNPKFTGEYQMKLQLPLIDILLANSQNFIKVNLKNNSVQNDIDQKSLPPPHSQLEMEPIHLPKQFPLQFHIQLYSLIAKEIELYQGKYKNLKKQRQKQIIEFWLQFLKRNKYNETSINKQYHCSVIDLLTHFNKVINSDDLTEKILKWVKGTESLALIFNCLPQKFLDSKKYSHIYDIILAGMKNKYYKIKADAIDVLLKCIKFSDYDDIDELLRNHSLIFTELISFFSREYLVEQIHDQNEKISFFTKVGYCVNIFLCTYDQFVFKCLQEGAGYVGAELICSGIPLLVKQGLQIFVIIAGIQDEQYKKQAQQFLINNISIQITNVWQKICKLLTIQNSDKQIRSYILQFIVAFFCNAQKNEIASLYRLLIFPKNETLVDILIKMFNDSDQTDFLVNILMVFRAIFYYQRQYDYQQYDDFVESDQQDQNQFQKGVNQITGQNVLFKMQSQGMLKKVQQLSYKQNIDKSLQQQLRILIQILQSNKKSNQ